ncbi:MAG: hypothetical protein WD696_15220 [Bryobacteraceae bacterium]
MLPALLLILGSSVVLVDKSFTVPRGDWRYLEVSLKQKPAVLHGEFGSSEEAGLRVAVLNDGQLSRLRSTKSEAGLDAIAIRNEGTLRVALERGKYAVVLDNRNGKTPIEVRLKVWLDFEGDRKLEVRTLSWKRRMVVIVASFVVFFGIVIYSARKLLKASRVA